MATHGKSTTPDYRAWQGMLNRCRNPNTANYYRYGGRGIKVCDKWLDFEVFVADMGTRPRGVQIDRIDNDGNYEPDNCRWVTPVENSRNRDYKNKLNISGIVKAVRSFQVNITANYKHIYLGSSRDFFEACCMRKSAENKYWNNKQTKEISHGS